eukprot:scaffold216819_cov37-Prasinocladus_malaysianus.AAC.1
MRHQTALFIMACKDTCLYWVLINTLFASSAFGAVTGDDAACGSDVSDEGPATPRMGTQRMGPVQADSPDGPGSTVDSPDLIRVQANGLRCDYALHRSESWHQLYINIDWLNSQYYAASGVFCYICIKIGTNPSLCIFCL